MSFYPKAESISEPAKADKATFAAEIIKQIDARDIKVLDDNCKALIIGDVMQGNDDVATFNEAFAEVAKERAKLLAVSGKDEAEYSANVAAVAVYVDPVKWTTEAVKAGLIATKEVVEIEEKA